MEQKIAHQVKVYFEEEIRRFTFSGYSFIDLITEIKRIFKFEEGETLTVHYQDEEKDLVLGKLLTAP